MNFVANDGGRKAEGFTHERLDCTVRSLSCALGCSYAAAHAHVEKFSGRAVGKTTRFLPSLQARSALSKLAGCKVRAVAFQPFKRRRVSSVLPGLSGIWIVGVRGHVFAVVDGVRYDTEPVGDRCLVARLWKIEFLTF